MFVYMDDIIVCALSEARFAELVEAVARRVRGAGGTLKPGKIRLGYPSEDILGSEVSKDGVRPSLKHLEAVRRLRMPTSASEMRSVVGLFTYFCDHLPWFSETAAPLYALTRADDTFPSVLPDPVVSAVEKLRSSLMSRPLLVPFDPASRLYVDSDASLVAAGACAYHLVDGVRRPIGFFSRKFTAAQTRWAPYVREAYALTLALQHFRDMVEAAEEPAIVYVDQKPLLWPA